ncbi:M28 family metallopeptidase [Dokdonella immobilis]|uniref:Zn-dependent amino-or carboxypeptidase, M28 family n=1 Tax=Dokdonella immobilis TaxID=578942 RepID=A0A1I4YFA2_9GAMM|nr:M28 family metallopeptidase [Dokdonella immobilis]SFN36741.1 Zn-dependent amino-or carboxypeptidase, M28 family [Dokdonella immobilis]
MNRILASAIALTLPIIAYAANAPTFDAKRLSDEVKVLSSDAFEGRGPATAGETKTVEYVIAQMKEAGLEPGGDLKDGKRLWTQAVPLLRAEIVGDPSLSIKVDGKAETLKQGEQIAVRAAMDGSTKVAIENAPLVFVGYGTLAPERKWDDFKGVDLKGKIAIALINDPDFESGQGDFGGKAMTYYGRWTYKYEEAARQGALGLLVVHETEPASYGWPTVKNSNTNTMFDVVRDDPKAVHTPVEGWLQLDTTKALFKQAGLDFDALKKQAQTRAFKPVPIKGASFSADYAVDSGVITSQNIVGRIDGSKHPDEFVIYSAHWDHLGVGQPDANGDTIYNGAVDNATGTAALIELGRAFAHAPKPERTVVFLNVTAEEKGLLGSEYYSSRPLYPLARTVGVINMDALDPTGVARNFTTSGSAQSDLLDALIADGKAAGMAYVTDPHPEAGHFFRSDHFPFAKRGVPSLSYGSGNDWVEGGIEAGEAAGKDYVSKRYHQPADEWQADWTFAGMAHDLPLLYKLGNDLANSRRWPAWGKDSEFRAIREASAAERK